MEYRHHPLIEGLKVSEDGSEIIFNGEVLQHFANDKNRANPTMKVNFHNKAHSVARLVCEAWNGLSQHIGQRAAKLNPLNGNHYSNLEWREGVNGVENFIQKINASDIDDILKLLENKTRVVEIAEMYGVHSSRIYRLREKHGKED
jgi:hypothetical protein